MQQPDYPEHFQTWPELMTTQDVADALGVSFDAASRVVAQLVMNGPAPRAVRQEPSRADNALKMIALALKPYLGGGKE